MGALRCTSVDEYIDTLGRVPGEAAELLTELLGSRSAFGADPGTWRAIAAQLASSSASRAALRSRFHAWSVGCATGEEAFTLAMMFAAAFGLEALGRHVDILATDIDGRALERARAATYDRASVATLPPSTLSEFFDERGGAFIVKEELRRVVRFERHDVLRDVASSDKHLVLCQDVVSALSVPGRRRATRRLVGALANGGLLVFGRGEWPEVGTHLETIDPVRGIYRKMETMMGVNDEPRQ